MSLRPLEKTLNNMGMNDNGAVGYLYWLMFSSSLGSKAGQSTLTEAEPSNKNIIFPTSRGICSAAVSLNGKKAWQRAEDLSYEFCFARIKLNVSIRGLNKGLKAEG